MSVRIYTSKEVQKIMTSGMLAFETHMELKKSIRPGVSTLDLDLLARDYIAGKGGKAAFLGFHGYPANICTSVNDVVVHGIPSKNVVLKEGDIVSIDLGVLYDGFYTDTAWTWPVGKVSDEARKLISVTQQCLYKGIQAAKAGSRIGAIGEAVQTNAESNGFSVVRSLVGHGVGKSIHEEPQVPNYGTKKEGMKIRSGMVLAIEPMINQGVYNVKTDNDKWTVRTADARLSAHFEHTVAITAAGPLICTLPKGAEINVFELMGID